MSCRISYFLQTCQHILAVGECTFGKVIHHRNNAQKEKFKESVVKMSNSNIQNKRWQKASHATERCKGAANTPSRAKFTQNLLHSEIIAAYPRNNQN